VQAENIRWHHVPHAPTNTVAPMPIASTDTVRMSVAGAAASQPHLTNSAPANPLVNPVAGSLLLNQYASGLFGPGSLLMGPNLSSAANLPGTNAGDVLGQGSSAASDPNVELASTLSRLMLDQASHSIALARQNLFASLVAANTLSGAAGMAGVMGPGLMNNAPAFPSLLSPDQRQLLLNASQGQIGQTVVHSSTALLSGMHSATTVSGSAPAALTGGQFGNATARSQPAPSDV